MRTKHIITYTNAQYTVTEDGDVARERGDKDMFGTPRDFQYTEGQLVTPFDQIQEGLSFSWYGVHEPSEGEGHSDIITTSYVVSIREDNG